MKLVVALALAASTSAFAPVPSTTTAVAARASSQLAAKPFEKAVGVTAPLGLFDPWGVLDDGDQEKYELLQYIELKHGRIAMLAVLGQVITKAGIHFPGYLDRAHTVAFADIPTGFGALEKIPAAGYIQFFLFIFFLEVGVMKDSANGAAPGEFPGDFRNGALDFGWDSFSEEEKLSKRAIELNNGRAAQMGILALMVHEELGVSLWPGGI